MTDNSARVIEIFTEASHLPIEERSAFLDRVCADKVLRAKVEALLKSNERVSGFMEAPAATVDAARVKVAAGEKSGDRIDRYVLLQQVGEGGCGVVFAAEQQSPVVRRVALKVVKPGMDTKSVIARFEAERQALALMDHPHIAHVFDAGTTESGRPYFVMELVEGVKITDYCDQHSLLIRARLDLFVQVCDAIQHAHQKGIIHRDIKPSNILVTTGPDGQPVPKVIDFGIAKAIGGQLLTDKTLFTVREMLIGTPAYMSPEQAALASAEVDTRTDIYSLGVLLYELLTGSTPFDTRELLKAGFDEVRRVIRDEEPVRPSTRLSTMIGADLEIVSKHHGADAPRLIREMRGDLDWIVMKALEKDRARRYATANGFAMDVNRYLTGEAILARPPSRWYHLQKLVERNRLLFASLSSIVAVLVIGFVIVTIALTREQAARREAEADKTESQQVTRFLEEMLEGVGPSVALGRDTTLLKEILDKTATRLAVTLTNQPAVQAELQMRLGQVYREIGQPVQAEAILRKALTIRTNLFGVESEPAAETMIQLGSALERESRADEAETYVRWALTVRQKLFGTNHIKVAECYLELAGVFWSRRQMPETEAMLRKGLTMRTQLLGENSPELTESLLGLASVLFEQGKPREAEPLLRQAITNSETALSADHPLMIRCVNNLAAILALQGKDKEAEPLLRRAVTTRRKLYGEVDPAVVDSLDGLARLLNRLKRFDEAEVTAREGLAVARKIWGDKREETLTVLRDLVNALLGQHKFEEAEQLFADLMPPGSESKPEFAGLLYERCDTDARCGHWRDAAEDATVLLKNSLENHENYQLLAPLLVQLNDIAGYQRLCRTILDKFSGTTDPFVADRMAKVCLILPSAGVDLKAVAAMAEVAVSRGSNTTAAPYFKFCKGLAEFRLGHYEEASTWARLATECPLKYPKACGFAVLAMSQFKLSHLDQARMALSQCNQIFEEQLPKADHELGREWRDWIIAHSLRDEAEKLGKNDKNE